MKTSKTKTVILVFIVILIVIIFHVAPCGNTARECLTNVTKPMKMKCSLNNLLSTIRQSKHFEKKRKKKRMK